MSVGDCVHFTVYYSPQRLFFDLIVRLEASRMKLWNRPYFYQVESQTFPLISIHCSLKLIPLIRLLHFNYFARRFFRWNLDDFQVSVLTDEESPFYVYHIEYDYKLPENARKSARVFKGHLSWKKIIAMFVSSNKRSKTHLCLRKSLPKCNKLIPVHSLMIDVKKNNPT